MKQNTVIWGIPYPVKRPKAREIGLGNGWFKVLIKGKEAWTNGSLLDFRQPQYDDFLLKIDTKRKAKSYDSPIPENLDEEKPTLIATSTSYIGHKVNDITFFLANSTTILGVQRAYHDYFKYFYPECEMFLSGKVGPVVVKEKGEIVGIFMPLRMDAEVLKTAKEKAEHVL